MNTITREFTLPQTKDVILTRPLTVGDYRKIERGVEKTKMSERFLIVVGSVVSVNKSVADSLDEMVSYLRALPSSDFKALEAHLTENSPALSGELEIECPKCGHTFKQTINFDTEFFRLNGGA
jgi:hypothetical protein